MSDVSGLFSLIPKVQIVKKNALSWMSRKLVQRGSFYEGSGFQKWKCFDEGV